MGRLGRKMARAAARQNASGAISPALREQLERLRQATIDATDFSVPWAMFHDEVTAVPGFGKTGRVAKHELLEAVLDRALKRFEPGCEIRSMKSFDLEGFWHGLVTTTVGPVVFYYYDDADIGLVGFMGSDGKSHFIRITAAQALPGAISAPRGRGSA